MLSDIQISSRLKKFGAKSKRKVQVDDILAMPIEKILESQRESKIS